MGVITKTIWETNLESEGNIDLFDVPDPDAYGLAIYVMDKAEVDPTVFYDGTLVIEVTTGNLFFVSAGALVQVAGGEGTTDRWVDITGDTMTGSLSLASTAILDIAGATPRQVINLYGPSYGIGVQSSTGYYRVSSVGNFAWYRGGVHSDAALDPGAGGIEMMRLVSSGLEVGRGLNYGRPLGLYGTNDGLGCNLSFNDGNGVNRKGAVGFDGSGSAYMQIRNDVANGTIFLQSQGNVTFNIGTSYTERGRVDTNGTWLWAKTASNYAAAGVQVNQDNRLWVTQDPAVSLFAVQLNGLASAAGFTFMQFTRSGAAVGSITQVSTNGVAYNTTSDRRLKRIISPIANPIGRLRQLKPVHFAWKSDDSEQDGLIADEVAPYVPEAVTGEPNAVEDDGTIIPQQLDYSKLVPLLTAALQQALVKIDELEQRVATLEAA